MADSPGAKGTPFLRMPDWADELPTEWSWHRLDDVCLDIVDCPHSTPEIVEDGPFLMARTSDILTGVFRAHEARRVSEATFRERVRRAEPRFGDLLYSREGTYFGLSAEVPPDTHVCLGQRMVLLRPDPRRVNPTFLRCWLNSSRVKSYVHGQRDGSVAERLNLPTIRQLAVCVPPLPDQRAIAHILGTLDDKIELNRRTNETLEAIARALFKSWFVDFDPVRAKSEGRDPGLPQPIADQFPDSFEDSELGEIPSGWIAQPFSNTIEIIGGGTPKTSIPEYWNGDIPWFSIVDAPTGSDVWVVNTEKRITRKGVADSSTRILPVGATIISARGTVGRVALVGVPMAMNQSCYGFLGKAGRRGFFTYFATRELVASLQQHAHGSVFDTITRETLTGVTVAVPPRVLIDTFEGIVIPALERLRAALVQSSVVAELRDALLPRLTSGQLHLNDADRSIQASPG